MFQKLKVKFKTNGFRGVLLSAFKGVLRGIGIKYNRFYYLVNEIDYCKQKEYWDKHIITDVRELTYDDFLLGDKEIFNDKKLNLIKERFSLKTYKAWGIVRGDALAYSCWLSFDEFKTSQSEIFGKLDRTECLMIDAYCNPKFRGMGLHGAMNSYRLLKGYEEGCSKCIVIILHENKPALKSQLKVGYKNRFIYYVFTIWGKTYTNYFKLKKNASK